MENTIILNISGKKYEISKTILLKIPYFTSMLTDCADQKEIFVSRSSFIFDHVLAYVIDNRHPFPLKYCYELYFYGISYHKSNIYQVIINDKRYEISENVLFKIPYFKEIIQINNMDNSIPIYIERSSILFQHVLSYIMNPIYLYPIEYEKELQFYGIIYDKNKLYNKDKVMQDHLYLIENRLENDHYKYEQYPCYYKACKKNINKETIFCDVHINESICLVKDCNNKSINFNYCDDHLNIDYNKDIPCFFKNCCLRNIVGKKYCYKHNK